MISYSFSNKAIFILNFNYILTKFCVYEIAIKKIFNSLITDLYKIDILRTTIVIIRFIFLFHIRKKIKYYIDPNKKIDDHIIVPREMSKKTVNTHNITFYREFF